MDRNLKDSAPALLPAVALRKESVDRNLDDGIALVPHQVALRKESVDRNNGLRQRFKWWGLSLSARRAWIEILALPGVITTYVSRSPQGERG